MKEIFKRIDGYKDYIIYLQTEMTARAAITPVYGGLGEAEKAKFLAAELKTLGADEIKFYNCAERPNIAAKFYGADKTKTAWIMAHMDVVPPGDVKLWKTDPFKAVVKGDKIYGRGTEDNQQGIVSALLAARAFKEMNITPNINIGILFVADEEMGNAMGSVFLMKKHKNIFGKKDFFLVPDVGDKDGVSAEIAEKNILWPRFTIRGAQCHASTPHAGCNAARAGNYLSVLLDETLHKKFNKTDKLFAPEVASTYEPTKREANIPNINTVPGTDVFCYDCRTLPCYSQRELKAVINACIKTIEKKFKVKVTLSFEHDAFSKPTAKNAQVVKLFSAAVKEVRKKPVKLIGIGGGTVAADFRNAGFDAVGIGKVDGTMHAPNEYSSIKNTISDAKVFAHIIFNAR